MPISVDDSRFPVVVLEWSGAVSVEEVDEAYSRLKALFHTRGKLVPIGVLRAGSAGLSSVRARAAQHDKEMVAMNAFIGNASVVDSPIVRGMLTGFLWLSATSIPRKTFASLEEALIWAKSLGSTP